MANTLKHGGDTMSNIQLANNLRFLRTKHKLTQDDLSSLLNISRQAYSNYETSKRTPDLDSLLHISRSGVLSMNWSLIIFRVLITQAL